MKLRAGELTQRLGRGLAGVLIFGPDPVAVDLRRDEAILAAAGPQAEADMRLTRLAAASLRSDPVALSDAMQARGFFPGPRAVVLDAASDGLADIIDEALTTAVIGEDAVLIATAGVLAARSKLRKLFESAPNAAACQLFDDPPGRGELAAILNAAGATGVAAGTLDALAALADQMDQGSLRQLCDTAVLHAGDAPVAPQDVAACAPLSAEGGIDDALAAAADGHPSALAVQLARLDAQGVAPTSVAIAAARLFRQLHLLACDPDGPDAAVGRLRPPVFGPRRAAMVARARRLGPRRIEQILRLVTETDLTLRSGRPVPGTALIGRTLMRIARASA
ncbi:MAG: DNA polymerase III subunit delta [Pseudomonadota bacterium]